MTEGKGRLFISYSRSDGKAFADDLRERLTAPPYSFPIWQDTVTMEGGRGWWRQIEEVIRSKELEYLLLVMTPGALASPVVRQEWRLARQEGKCVILVIGAAGLDFDAMPNWMRRVHFVDTVDADQWRRLVRTLEGPCYAARMPFMAPPLPDDFVDRPAELDRLVVQLLDQRGEPVAITGVIQGAGGYGKTVLASVGCHDERVQSAFDDGILWITLGTEPGDILARMAGLVEVLTGQRTVFEDMDHARSKWAEALGERRLLIVVDDVWKRGHLEPFLAGGPHCTRLVTTRNRATAPAGSKHVDVDAMATTEAVRLLRFGLPEEEHELFTALAERLGEWPLLLKLVNGVLRRKVLDARGPLADALDYVKRALDRRGLTAFDARQETDRGDAVAKTVGVSLELLSDAERERYAELAVFPEDVDIPLAAVETLWAYSGGLDDLDTEELCQRLFDLSLLSLDLSELTLRLHDVLREYLQPREGEARSSLHGILIEAYGKLCHKGWASGPEDGYFFRFLPHHLRRAGRLAEMRDLLTSYPWLRARLEATDIRTLIADYGFDVEIDKTLRLVSQALMLSAHVLTEDKGQLAIQLVGRLHGIERPDIAELLDQVKNACDRPWLCPLSRSLTAPGGSLLLTFAGTQRWVNSVAVTADGSRALSGGGDGTVRLWDLETGAEIRRLNVHEGEVSAVAVTPDGARAVSGGEDGAVRLWDLETGAQIRRLNGHEGKVAAVVVTSDGSYAVSGSADGTIRIWDLNKGVEIRMLTGHGDAYRQISIWYDGDLPLEHTAEYFGDRVGVNAVALTEDGARVITGGDDGTVRLWDLVTGSKICTIAKHKKEVTSVAVTADGALAARHGERSEGA